MCGKKKPTNHIVDSNDLPGELTHQNKDQNKEVRIHCILYNFAAGTRRKEQWEREETLTEEFEYVI